MAVYIWAKDGEWKPDANHTRFYFPLESNANDYSWRTDITITNTSTNITYAELWWVKCANGNGSNAKITFSPNWIINRNTDTYSTFSLLFYAKSYSTGSSYTKIMEWAIQNTCYITANFQSASPLASVSTNQRHLYTVTQNKNTQLVKAYVDWVFVSQWTDTYAPRWNWANSYEQAQNLFCNRWWTQQFFNWWVREFLWENIEWTAEQVATYRTWIKKKLWIS